MVENPVISSSVGVILAATATSRNKAGAPVHQWKQENTLGTNKRFCSSTVGRFHSFFSFRTGKHNISNILHTLKIVCGFWERIIRSLISYETNGNLIWDPVVMIWCLGRFIFLLSVVIQSTLCSGVYFTVVINTWLKPKKIFNSVIWI